MPVFGVVCIVLGMVAGCISCLVLSKAADKAYGTVIDCLKDCQSAVSEEELNRLKDGAKATVGQKLVPLIIVFCLFPILALAFVSDGLYYDAYYTVGFLIGSIVQFIIGRITESKPKGSQ